MTKQQVAMGHPSEDTAPGSARGRAVEALTTVARRRRTIGADTAAEHEEQVDFAGELSQILAAVASNLGGTEALVAGRPGSWEADLVARFLTGTVGPDEADLAWHRTEPIQVWLDVEAHLSEQTNGAWDAAWSALIDTADAECGVAYQRALVRHSADPRVVPEEDRRRSDNMTNLLAVPDDVRAIWERIGIESRWLHRVDRELAAARRFLEAVAIARTDRETEYQALLVAAVEAGVVARGFTVPVATTTDYDPQNWLGEELLSEALAITAVPDVPTVREIRHQAAALADVAATKRRGEH